MEGYKRENPFYDNLLYFHRSAELAYRWGTLDKRDELLTEPRPLYQVCVVSYPSFPF
jgi:hypothetical protein